MAKQICKNVSDYIKCIGNYHIITNKDGLLSVFFFFFIYFMLLETEKEKLKEPFLFFSYVLLNLESLPLSS